MKKAISIRLDPDIISFFKQEFRDGYQKGMSQVLREFVDRRTKAMHYAAGRGQELYRQFHAQCFWHMRKDLEITAEHLSMIKDGLRRYGGAKGFKLAAELDRTTGGDLCP